MTGSREEIEAERLMPLARSVLESYPFEVREVTHLATHSNVMYRVVTEAGQQMVLRVGTPHANSRSNIESEVAWLDALGAETRIEVVQPVHAADGSLIVDAPDEEIGRERSCVLFTWIPGEPMGEGSGTFGYRLLGAMCASLQAHGRTWTPPDSAQPRKWDRIFYYDTNFDPLIIHDPAYNHIFDAPRRRTIRRAEELAQLVIEESHAASESQIVHGDLHEWNVHLASSRLYAFDFEDIMYATPEQDISICLYFSRNRDDRDQVRDSFRKGYETISDWPVADDAQLEGFQAARQIMLMNYATRTLPESDSTEYLDGVMPWLEGYVSRYG